MSNILNHNRNIFDFKINKSNYWDFHLCVDINDGNTYEDADCLSANIDINNSDCVWFDTLYSKKENVWVDAVNDGLSLNSIGFTGMDNGLITFEKDKITNREFLDLFLNSRYSVEKGDKRFVLNKVNGNNKLYDYSTDVTYVDGVQVVKLNGGFYQGFFKSDNYQVLPDDINDGVCFSFTLKKEDFINSKITLNDNHPNNKGFFFYIGTRAENKWWKKYTTSFDYKKYLQEYTDGYSKEYFENESTDEEEYVTELPPVKEGKYFSNGYISDTKEDRYFDENSDCCNHYVEEGYIEKDIKIDKDMHLSTAEGYDLYQPNIVEYKTDNKFITYNHGKDGFTVKDKSEDCEVVLYDIKAPDIENYFLLFHHGCNGYTTKNIQSLIDKESKKYDVLADLYNNALGFRITDDGSIGYRYLVQDCEKGGYKIEEEYSYPNVVDNKWCVVDIKIVPSGQKIKFLIYVNAKLILVSKELPKTNLRSLNDLSSKQEGVPYNISIGGGTQGLCDTIGIDYLSTPDSVLPLEQNFAGTFIGYLKSFKVYDCQLNYSVIQRKVEEEDKLLNRYDIYNI